MSTTLGGCVVVYDKLNLSTSLLCETWAANWDVEFVNELKAVGINAYIPTCIVWMLLRGVFGEYHNLCREFHMEIRKIGKVLDMGPIFEDRLPVRLEDYFDLARTTRDLTLLAQRAAQMKSNLARHQELVAAVHELHEEFGKTIQDSAVTVTRSWLEVGDKLSFFETDIRELQRQVDVHISSIQAQIQTVCQTF